MNNILFLFREEGRGKAATPYYILIRVPVLSLFSSAKCLVYPSREVRTRLTEKTPSACHKPFYNA